MWEKLDDNWKEVLRLSWEAYINGTIPVGAVIVNEKNEIVSKGRNMSYDDNIIHPLARTSMGHAEMVAMMNLKKNEHPNISGYKVYVSLEPCYMCFGTMLMMGIKKVYYSAKDNETGSSVMVDKTDYIIKCGIDVIKNHGEMEIFQIILHTSRGQFNPVKGMMEPWEKEYENAVPLGQKLHDEHYFLNAIRENRDISDIYDDVLSMYYSK
ncbi:MAG: nucleoside deaminase [Clostridia bacterium]|nr:nucleoside deaminase [Clostridia bacterium]